MVTDVLIWDNSYGSRFYLPQCKSLGLTPMKTQMDRKLNQTGNKQANKRAATRRHKPTRTMLLRKVQSVNTSLTTGSDEPPRLISISDSDSSSTDSDTDTYTESDSDEPPRLISANDSDSNATDSYTDTDTDSDECFTNGCCGCCDTPVVQRLFLAASSNVPDANDFQRSIHSDGCVYIGDAQ